ncbi:hypothetical protein [Natronoglycomyces albus]|uniref:Uncharacterized protein n=1 Tax=Natronoglycomyces albus TaxID=2811108 RepID=A0A895XH31_9ACTN|nr:hypothetical protein [Natronoglycomyces albus]QSB04654.1 hypothetical protein JQS30_12850 [Natronoglycomyces albus]
MFKRSIAIVSLLGVVASVASCSEATDTSDTADRFSAIVAENRVLHFEFLAARERVAEVCLENAGYPAAEVDFFGGDVWDRDYILVDRYWEGGPTANDLLTPAEHDGMYAAAYGNDEFDDIELENGRTVRWATAGCIGQANQVLLEDDQRSFFHMYSVATAAAATTWQDTDEVVAARAKWAACMEQAGYPELEIPEDADIYAADAAYHAGLRPTSSGEDMTSAVAEFEAAQRELAEVDIACHEEAGLESIQAQAFWAEAGKILTENEVEVFAYGQRAKEILNRAQDIIANGTLD